MNNADYVPYEEYEALRKVADKATRARRAFLRTGTARAEAKLGAAYKEYKDAVNGLADKRHASNIRAAGQYNEALDNRLAAIAARRQQMQDEDTAAAARLAAALQA